MENMVSSIKKIGICFSFLGSLALAGNASAATIAWWSFEEPDIRPATVSLASRVNGSLYNAALGASGSILSTTTPAPGISSETGGTTYANLQSLAQNAGATNSLSSAATSPLNDVFVNNQTAWTFETFVYMPTGISGGYGQLFGNGTPAGAGIQFDMGSDNRHFRFISNGAVLMSVDSLPPFDLDTWYHLALTATYVEGGWNLAFFINYSQINSATGVQFTTTSQDYTIASPSNSFGGYVDEMRISDAALTPGQMLQLSAVPEPSVYGMLAAAGVMAAVLRRRKS